MEETVPMENEEVPSKFFTNYKSVYVFFTKSL